MSPDSTTDLALLAGYLVIAGSFLSWMWRASRRMPSIGLRLALRAFAMAFLLAPGAVACGAAMIFPSFLVAIADIFGQNSANGCSPYTPLNFVSLVLTFAIAAIALRVLDRLRHH